MHIRRNILKKLCCLQLPFKKVIYIDVDTIVLTSFKPVFDAINEKSTQFIYASLSPEYVYTASTATRSPYAGKPWFSDGFFATSKKYLNVEDISRILLNNLIEYYSVRGRAVSQSVTNFVAHHLNLATASLPELAINMSDTNYHLGPIRNRQGTLIDNADATIPFVHWAGVSEVNKETIVGARWHEIETIASNRLRN